MKVHCDVSHGTKRVLIKSYNFTRRQKTFRLEPLISLNEP